MVRVGLHHARTTAYQRRSRFMILWYVFCLCVQQFRWRLLELTLGGALPEFSSVSAVRPDYAVQKERDTPALLD